MATEAKKRTMCTTPTSTLSIQITVYQMCDTAQRGGHWVQQTNTTSTKPHAEDTKVTRFTDKFGVTEDEFCEINDDFIDELVDQNPDDAKASYQGTSVLPRNPARKYRTTQQKDWNSKMYDFRLEQSVLAA
jgi:hypothetical protein